MVVLVVGFVVFCFVVFVFVVIEDEDDDDVFAAAAAAVTMANVYLRIVSFVINSFLLKLCY